MWFCDEQLPEKSRISEQLPKWSALCLLHSYPTRHGAKYFISWFSIGGRLLGMQVSIQRAIYLTLRKTTISVHIFFNGCLPVNHDAFLWYTKRFLEPLLGRKVRWNICVEEQIISGEKKTRTFLDLIGARGVYHLSNIFLNAHRIKNIGQYHSDIPYSKQ